MDALAWMLWVGGIGCGAGDVNAADGDDVRRFVGLRGAERAGSER